MPRRQSGLEVTIELISMLPWWVGALAAVLSYLFLSDLAEAPLPSMEGLDTQALVSTSLNTGVVRGVAAVGQYLVPLLCAIGAVTSFFQRRHRQTLLRNTQRANARRQAIEALSWQDFERLVGEAFRRQGYGVTETDAGPDGGVDLILSREGEQHLVQCKQWRATQVGVNVVRELFGVMAAQGAAGGVVVTSGAFTKPARNFAEGRNIELIDGEALDKFIAIDAEAVGSEEDNQTCQSAHRNDDTLAPACPLCGTAMVMRRAKRGSNAGQDFWGCSRFPICRGTRALRPL